MNEISAYVSKDEKIILKVGRKEYEGKVYINEEQGIIRIYNFPKDSITSEEKTWIIYALLEKYTLLPSASKSTHNRLPCFTLRINGTLTNSPNEDKYPLVIEYVEDTVDVSNEPERSKMYKKFIKTTFNENIAELGKKWIKTYILKTKGFAGVYDYSNACLLLDYYLYEKGFECDLSMPVRLFKKRREVYIHPLGQHL